MSAHRANGTSATPPRKKRVWSAADFAEHVFGEKTDAARRRAVRELKRLDAKHGNKLLRASTGKNRRFTFLPAMLYRLEPALFEAIESLEERVAELEERADLTDEHFEDASRNLRRVAVQVGQNTRDIAKLRSARR